MTIKLIGILCVVIVLWTIVGASIMMWLMPKLTKYLDQDYPLL